MAIVETNSVIVESPINQGDQFARTGVIRQDSFAIRAPSGAVQQIQFDATQLPANTTATIQANASNTGNITLPPFAACLLQATQLTTQYNNAYASTSTTQAVSAGTQAYLVVTTATSVTLNLSLPATPGDGFVLRVINKSAVTNLSVVSVTTDTISGAPTSLAANAPFSLLYSLTNTTWYKT